MHLPVDDVLPQVIAALKTTGRAILVAPPGAGKTTRVPPAILRSSLIERGDILLLQPRRVAARSLAARLASELGEPVGQTVGYQIRHESKVSKATRIRVITEGILTRWLQRDPELTGVGTVILDEFHERSLHADLGLAFVREIQDVLREDLALLVMSATLDPAPLSAYLGDCPIIETEGRAFPVELTHQSPRSQDSRDLGAMAAEGVHTLLSTGSADTDDGDILVFLPGVREIEDARQALTRRPCPGRSVVILHGRLTTTEQSAVLRPSAGPRIILATNIAETSLTLPNITGVVDTGVARSMHLELSTGLDRLVLGPISKASADQRAGRAGRVRPGRALRLWSEAEHGRRPAFEAPELQRVDLSRTLLELRAWGVRDPGAFGFFEAPSPAAIARAQKLLLALGLIDAINGPLSAQGRAALAIPAHPRVAVALLHAAEAGHLQAGAEVAALLEAPMAGGPGGPGGPGGAGGRHGQGPGGLSAGSDLLARRRRWQRGAHRGDPVARTAKDLARAAKPWAKEHREGSEPEAIGRALLAGFPDRLCRRLNPASDDVAMVGGIRARLGRASSVRDDTLLIALDLNVASERKNRWVRAASGVDPEWLDGSPLKSQADEREIDMTAERVVTFRRTRWMDLILDERPLSTPRDAETAACLNAAARRNIERVAPKDGPAIAWLARAMTLARIADDLDLPQDRESWLQSALDILCTGQSSFEGLRRANWKAALADGVDWKTRQALDARCPVSVALPSGRSGALTYREEGPPILAVKIQELFGSEVTPAFDQGRRPVTLHLLNPAGRPLQVTADLASFWTRTWPAVRGEMRSRYPRHRWPEDPANAEPSVRTMQRKRRR